MSDLDELDVEVFDDDTDANYARISKKDLESLRGAAKNGSKSRRELELLQREKAVNEAGLTDLTEKQRSALATLVKEPTAETLRAEAIALGFIAAPVVDEPSADELAAHGQAAQIAQGGGAPIATQVTAEEANGWPADKLMRLQQTHPDTYEHLLRGEAIQLPAGFQ